MNALGGFDVNAPAPGIVVRDRRFGRGAGALTSKPPNAFMANRMGFTDKDVNKEATAL